jgi:high-affinity K+ transport system ATPase subunit B
MLKILDEAEQNEGDVFIPMNNVSDDESTKLNELSFPWPLINTIKQSFEYLQPKSLINAQLLFSFRLQLLVVFSICILCIVFGSVFLNDCYERRMLCIIFIIQGTCGVFVVLVNVWAIVSE